jgi:glycosyltransferase involved in cell wall biosynthesis
MISIIIPTYNSNKTIEGTLKSVLEQNVDVEIIVVDDCSTDNTVELAKKTAPNCKIIQLPFNSGGPNIGRNIGIAMCKGDYICFLDHDDKFNKGKLSKQLEQMESCDICSTGFQINNEELNKFKVVTANDKGIITFPPKYIYNQLLTRDFSYPMYLSSLMIKREKIKFFSHKSVDFEWLLEITENSVITLLNEPLVLRNVHGNNLSLEDQYREDDYLIATRIMKKQKNYKGLRKIYNSRAKHFYYLNKPKPFMFLRYPSVKNLVYFFTAIFGLSKFVNKKFNFFG